jgi:hypothetical protein
LKIIICTSVRLKNWWKSLKSLVLKLTVVDGVDGGLLKYFSLGKGYLLINLRVTFFKKISGNFIKNRAGLKILPLTKMRFLINY